MTRLRVIDIETTGTEPPAEIIEFGRVDVIWDGSDALVEKPMARLYRPLNGIPPETKAVHHITEADFTEESPVCSPERLRQAVWGGETPHLLVAHNAVFEQQFVKADATDALPWICTYKAALRVWGDAPKHGNQVLRYWLGLNLDLALAMPPHRAGPDAYVTAHILAALLKVATPDQMIAWTLEPRLIPAIPFGKHRGLAWSDAPKDYLQWMSGQTDMDADVVWHAQQELGRRRG